LFPRDINTFVDLFGGGFNVGINVNAKKVYYNDAMTQVVDMLEYFKIHNTEDMLNQIDEWIKLYELTKTNSEGYIEFRNYYNKCKNPLVLYTLICYSFNNQIRFNSKGEYNMPFGKDRSSFNPSLREKFITFINQLQNKQCNFCNKDFRDLKIEKLNKEDFVYCDPPYLITIAAYNENGGWTEKDERDLLHKLDTLNDNEICFALSNILEGKGRSNEILKEWSKKYNTYYLNHTYSNCNYQKKDKNSKDIEVLITNYKADESGVLLRNE
jgi:DNA adenine methylase